MKTEELTPEFVLTLFKETDRKFQENQQEMLRMSEETDRKFQENQQEMRRISEETDRKFKETDRKFKETDKKINKVAGIFSSQWGKLMEAIITPSCLKLFKNRNIDVTRTYSNVEIRSSTLNAEFDVVLANGTEVVVVEVKTDMTVNKIDHFLGKLADIKLYLPEHKDKKIYGAVAGIKYSENCEKYAYRKGLFILRNSGDYILELANSTDFNPTDFS